MILFQNYVATLKLLESVKNLEYPNVEKNSIDQKMWTFFVLEPARLLKACKPGSRARMDSSTGRDMGRL